MTASPTSFCGLADARAAVVTVNHDTSAFCELVLRGVIQAERSLADISFTVMDNSSARDTAFESLRSLAEAHGADIVDSGYAIGDQPVTHGDVLRDFVLRHETPECFLFLDSDVVFIEEDTIATMVEELRSDDARWAVQARFVRIERRDGDGASLERHPTWPSHLYWLHGVTPRDDIDVRELRYFPSVTQPRVHPACLLVRNTPAFRRFAETLGFSVAHVLSHSTSCGGYYDTFGLVGRAMTAVGLEAALSRRSVHHFKAASYGDDQTGKREACEKVLSASIAEGLAGARAAVDQLVAGALGR